MTEPPGPEAAAPLLLSADVDPAAALPPAPQLSVVAGLPPASYPLAAGEVVVGRASDADLQLRHPEISRRHCRLSWDTDAQAAFIEDLGSRWGTKVNSAPLPANTRTPLQAGDLLGIGPVLVHFGFGPPPPQLLAGADRAGTPDQSGAGSGAPAGGGGLVTAPGGPSILLRGRPVERIALGEKNLTFGRGDDNDAVLADPGISRRHATVERAPDDQGFRVTDLHSRAGSLVNGRRFESHLLVIGDQLQMGPFFFRFDGLALERTSGLAGVELEARHVAKRAGATVILDDVSVHVDRGQFVAILGPSGSGKSSLLDTLTGLRPGQGGQILYDGADFYRNYDALRLLLGYVPQDDIVHTELTVVQALHYSARLRLPANTPRVEIEKLVTQTVAQLGLEARAHTPIARLSGGQRKRVSVGVELLGSPAVLFLDEPTSGLDPAAEGKMMELLRHLADSGCTVVCTTHVMENVYLTDRIFVIAAGRLVFAGGVAEAREHFGVAKLPLIYDRLEERPATAWRERLMQMPNPPPEVSLPPVSPTAAAIRPRLRAAPRRAPLRTLLARRWAILKSDPRNFFILLGQPLVIAALVGWVSTDASLSLFFAYLATLWFGTSNAAQEIVRELPIYRRERMVGLGRHAYLLSKFILFGALTAAQAIFLFLCLKLFSRGDELDGSVPWQLGSLVGTALAGVGIGFAISALVRKTMQAVMIVPLVLIPQIVFSGLVFPASDMKPLVLNVSRAVPSFAAQRLMDVSLLWQQTIAAPLMSRHRPSFNNLNLRRDLRNGDVYNRLAPGLIAAASLLGWAILGYLAAWFGLRAKERG